MRVGGKNQVNICPCSLGEYIRDEYRTLFSYLLVGGGLSVTTEGQNVCFESVLGIMLLSLLNNLYRPCQVYHNRK